jgi:hypothetical protein
VERTVDQSIEGLRWVVPDTKVDKQVKEDDLLQFRPYAQRVFGHRGCKMDIPRELEGRASRRRAGKKSSRGRKRQKPRLWAFTGAVFQYTPGKRGGAGGSGGKWWVIRRRRLRALHAKHKPK